MPSDKPIDDIITLFLSVNLTNILLMMKVRLGVLTPTCVVLAVFVGFCGSLCADISKLSSISVQLLGGRVEGFQTFSGYILFGLLIV